MKKTKQPKSWHLNESVNAGIELRDFALGIITQDSSDVIRLTISDFLRILRGFTQGFAFLTADTILDADDVAHLRQSITCLEIIADATDRRREIFGGDEQEQA